jgi:hypothetical protein
MPRPFCFNRPMLSSSARALMTVDVVLAQKLAISERVHL